MSLFVYHPVTRRSRLGWEMARFAAGRGAFGIRRGLPLVPREVWEATARLIPEGGAMAIARANHPGRFISLVVSGDGRLKAFVKVARDSIGATALIKERLSIERWGPLLTPPLYAPRVLDHRYGALILEPVEWIARTGPWRMDEGVAHSLGRFYRATSSSRHPEVGVSHGDCAPWNVLQTRSGWALIDWEDADENGSPFFDLFHFFVQSSGELGRPTKRTLLAGMELHGPVGESIKAYAAGAERDPRETKPMFREYLERSAAGVEPGIHPRALRIRRQLARMMES
jgi:hypothetical protein